MRDRGVSFGFDGVRSLFQAALQQELQRNLRKIFCESLLHPRDAFWLEEQLAELYRDANKRSDVDGSEFSVKVAMIGEKVFVSDKESKCVLLWKDCWRPKHKSDLSLEGLVRYLSSWTAYAIEE